MLAKNPQQELVKLLNQRSYMQDVALFKAQHQLPIEDRAREAVVLKKAQADAGKNGLESNSIQDFLVAQIKASKAIQYRYRADWLSGSVSFAHPPRDLVHDVRPALLSLGHQIVLKVKESIQSKGLFINASRSDFIHQMKVKHLNLMDKNHLFDALLKIRLKK